MEGWLGGGKEGREEGREGGVVGLTVAEHIASDFDSLRQKENKVIQAGWLNSLLSNFRAALSHTVRGIFLSLQIPKDSSPHRNYLGSLPENKQA